MTFSLTKLPAACLHRWSRGGGEAVLAGGEGRGEWPKGSLRSWGYGSPIMMCLDV